MAANTQPIFSRVGKVMWSTVNVIAGNTTRDLTTGTVYQLTPIADATNGSRVDKVIIQPRGTNVSTPARIWINNGGPVTTATNSFLLKEVTMAASTASEAVGLASVETTLDLALPPGYSIYVTIGTTVAAGFHVSAVGGDY